MKFNIRSEDVAIYGPSGACARAYILKRLERPLVCSLRTLTEEIGVSRNVVARTLNDLLAEGLIRRGRRVVDHYEEGRAVCRHEYVAKGHWGWPV